MTAHSSEQQTRTQVLIVGAGPVGLLAALHLSRQGIDVCIVEQQSAERAHTFPVVLHPQSLRILNDLDLAPALFWRGRPVTRLAVYTDYERRAVLDLPKAVGVSPGALTLPQDILRQALTNALARRGVDVAWNTRLAALQQDQGAVRGQLVHEAGGTNARPDLSAFEADFVIGADGYDSTVRQALAIELDDHGGLESYAFFDVPSERAGSEAQLAISEDFANAVYPLQGGVARFSFQIGRELHYAPDERLLRELIRVRLPWYADAAQQCEWAGVAEFRHALARTFGLGRVWLAGEAAHQTGPLGVQSLNVGLDEASELAELIGQHLAQPSGEFSGAAYDLRRRRQWRRLLGVEELAPPSVRSPAWARRYASRLFACLPASDTDLDDLLNQLRLTGGSVEPGADVPAREGAPPRPRS